MPGCSLNVKRYSFPLFRDADGDDADVYVDRGVTAGGLSDGRSKTTANTTFANTAFDMVSCFRVCGSRLKFADLALAYRRTLW